MSKSASGLISRPVVRVMYCARRALLASLQSRKAFWKPLSSANWTRRSILGRSVSQSSEPSVLVISAASAGLHCSSQRRGVMPLVTLVNSASGQHGRSGRDDALSGPKKSTNGLNISLTRRECSAATPLTLCEPMIARLAMRSCCG